MSSKLRPQSQQIKPPLKLYVWRHLAMLRDHYDGLAVALATDLHTARLQILRTVLEESTTKMMSTAAIVGLRTRLDTELRMTKPEIHAKPAAVIVRGGG